MHKMFQNNAILGCLCMPFWILLRCCTCCCSPLYVHNYERCPTEEDFATYLDLVESGVDLLPNQEGSEADSADIPPLMWEEGDEFPLALLEDGAPANREHRAEV